MDTLHVMQEPGPKYGGPGGFWGGFGVVLGGFGRLRPAGSRPAPRAVQADLAQHEKAPRGRPALGGARRGRGRVGPWFDCPKRAV